MRLALALALIAGLVVIAVAMTTAGAFAVLFGWIPFLWRVVPQLQPDGPTVLVGAVAILLFTAGVHWLGHSRRAARNPVTRWRFRWTLAVVAGVVLMFTAGIAVIGITHQIAWLATSEQPLLGERLHEPGRERTAAGNLREISLGFLNYESSNNALPPGGTFSSNGEMLQSWETHILLYMGIFAGIDMERPWTSPENERYFKSVIPSFINPEFRTPALEDANGFGLSHYAANVNVMSANRGLKLSDIPNGTANTILLGEVNAGFKPWGHPVNWRDPAAGLNAGPTTFGGPPNSYSTTFGMADGSVRVIRNDVDPTVLRELSGGNVRK